MGPADQSNALSVPGRGARGRSARHGTDPLLLLRSSDADIVLTAPAGRTPLILVHSR
jgi:hypothetical protein